MTLSKQNNFIFNSLLEDIRGSKCCVFKVRQYIIPVVSSRGVNSYYFRVQGNIIPVVNSRGVNSIISGCRVILFLW